MNKIRFLLSVLFHELTERYFIVKAMFFAVLFLFFSFFVINIQNVLTYGFSDYPLDGRVKIVVALFLGAFQSVSGYDLLFLFLVSILFGINLQLVFRRLKFLRRQKGLHLTIGVGAISLAVTGCASCGLSLVSLIGIGGALAILPFGGMELYFLAVVLLLFSLLYNLNSFVKACNIPQR